MSEKRFSFWVVLAVLALGLAAVLAPTLHAQSNIGQVKAAAINTFYYPGVSPYLTIQSAVTPICAGYHSGPPGAAVVLLPGYVLAENPTTVTGCAGALIFDYRTTPWTCYASAGGLYASTACTAGGSGGGPNNYPAVTHQFLNAYNSGTSNLSGAQPSFADINGVAAAAQLPLATSAAIGGVRCDGTSITCTSGVIAAVGAPPTGAAGTAVVGTYPGALLLHNMGTGGTVDADWGVASDGAGGVYPMDVKKLGNDIAYFGWQKDQAYFQDFGFQNFQVTHDITNSVNGTCAGTLLRMFGDNAETNAVFLGTNSDSYNGTGCTDTQGNVVTPLVGSVKFGGGATFLEPTDQAVLYLGLENDDAGKINFGGDATTPPMWSYGGVGHTSYRYVSPFMQALGGGLMWADPSTGQLTQLAFTTTGSSGAATLSAGTLNIPVYAGGGSMTWPAAAGIAVYAGGSAWGTSLTAPSSAIVGISDTQTLTNKTLDGVTPATMAFVDPTSSIQTQLNAKMTNPMTTSGDLILGGSLGAPGRLGIGSNGQTLGISGSTVQWVTPLWPVANGGTGVATSTAHGVHIGQGTSAQTTTAAGATNAVFVGQGASADPIFAAQPTIDCTNCTNIAKTVANGTSALGTGAISSGTCATVVTTTATGVATTDVIGWGFNGDPTAVTGYSPTVNGMLTIIVYPTSGNVNFKVCNNTSASVTPGAITLNWRVGR